MFKKKNKGVGDAAGQTPGGYAHDFPGPCGLVSFVSALPTAPKNAIVFDSMEKLEHLIDLGLQADDAPHFLRDLPPKLKKKVLSLTVPVSTKGPYKLTVVTPCGSVVADVGAGVALLLASSYVALVHMVRQAVEAQYEAKKVAAWAPAVDPKNVWAAPPAPDFFASGALVEEIALVTAIDMGSAAATAASDIALSEPEDREAKKKALGLLIGLRATTLELIRYIERRPQKGG